LRPAPPTAPHAQPPPLPAAPTPTTHPQHADERLFFFAASAHDHCPGISPWTGSPPPPRPLGERRDHSAPHPFPSLCRCASVMIAFVSAPIATHTPPPQSTPQTQRSRRCSSPQTHQSPPSH